MADNLKLGNLKLSTLTHTEVHVGAEQYW